MLGGPYIIIIDNTAIMENYNAPTNGTHAFIYLAYAHSKHTIEIIGTTVIPEYPSNIAWLGFLLLMTIPLVFTKRKGKPNSKILRKRSSERIRTLILALYFIGSVSNV